MAIDSVVEILELQPAGKRRMTPTEFLRGHRLQAGRLASGRRRHEASAAAFRGPHHNARSLALQILLDCRKPRRASFRKSSTSIFGHTPLAAADRRLVTQLVYGVLRRRGTLQALLEPLRESPRRQGRILAVGRSLSGACQLALLTHIPAHAAVHETVELAVAFGRPEAKGFLNGILRSWPHS